jgi:hypothetical protein
MSMSFFIKWITTENLFTHPLFGKKSERYMEWIIIVQALLTKFASEIQKSNSITVNNMN